MDRFLSKRPPNANVVSQPPSKKPSPAAKQGKVSALVRVAEFGRDKFYADGDKLFCRACNVVIEHTRKNTVLPRRSRDFLDFCRDEAAIFSIFTATLPRFS